MRLTPDNMLLSLTAPEVDTDTISVMYQTPYSVVKIADVDLAKWRSPDIFTDLVLPSANPYIPDDLGLIVSNEALNTPQLIVDSKQVSAWHFPDTRFGVPKAHIIASLKASGIDSPEAFAALELYLAYINDQLSAAVYPAREAGLSFSLQPSERGIAIVVGGYSDKQAVLLEDILTALANPDWDAARFERIQQGLSRDMSNFAQQYPFRQVVASFNSIIKGQWTPLQKVTGVEQVSMSELKRFAANLLESLSLEVLISGNHDQASAMQLVSNLSSWTELQQTVVTQSVAKLSLGEQRAQIPVDHTDAALMLYLQGRDDSLTERAHMLLLGEMLASPFYTSLRTEKQLGYVVAAFASNNLRVPGLAMIVQSPSADVATIKSEMTGFLAAYRDQVGVLAEADLQRYKASVLSGLEETPKNLGEMNSRFMESLGLGYSAFDFRQQLAVEIASVTIESLSSAYQAVTADQLRELVVETIDGDQEGVMVDLRKLETVYEYEFR
jgi:secreted Zn-dependent insulinase-like peptidase